MVLNDIIEQAAGRQSRTSDRGGKNYVLIFYFYCVDIFHVLHIIVTVFAYFM